MSEDVTEPASEPVVEHAAPVGDEKRARAEGIYLGWRNEFLGGLPSAVFQKIEAEAPHLITAIAAAL